MILDDLVAAKKRELTRSLALRPLSILEGMISHRPPPLDLAAALKGPRVRLIAEVKKASPSKGLIAPSFDPIALARTYAENGAAAISVLTEADYFQGSLEYLQGIKENLEKAGRAIPLLRKDFIFTPYQVYEARAFGADAILLIVAILEDRQLSNLLAVTHRLGMKALVETHTPEEVERAVASSAEIIGINNRDLRTFVTDINTTQRLRPLIPPGRLVVSESGIRTREDVERLKEWGVNAVLVGEALVAAGDVASKMRELA